MYVKLYEQILGSSVWEEAEHVRLCWVGLLLSADRKGEVDMTLAALARRINMDPAKVDDALKVLSSPDPESRTLDEEGRRIVPLHVYRSWGWRIVNYVNYRDMKDEEARRKYMREYMRRRRQAKAGIDVAPPLTPVNTRDMEDEEARRKYMREYMRRRRQAKAQLEGGNGVAPPLTPVNTRKHLLADADADADASLDVDLVDDDDLELEDSLVESDDSTSEGVSPLKTPKPLKHYAFSWAGQDYDLPEPELVDRVFAFWAGRCRRDNVRLTAKRKAKLLSRLKDSSVEEVLGAVVACSQSDYHMGHNDAGKVYNDLAAHVLPSRDKVEWWLARTETERERIERILTNNGNGNGGTDGGF